MKKLLIILAAMFLAAAWLPAAAEGEGPVLEEKALELAAEIRQLPLQVPRDLKLPADLPDDLKMTARVHTAKPGASIEELGKLVSPPLGKSGMYNRLKRLLEIAKAID